MKNDSGFVFSTRSKKKLDQVHPKLVEVITEALRISPIDFSITEGVRTIGQQQLYFKEGKSQTMKSRHLPQKDGMSHAVDVAAYVEGKVSWDWEYYEQINKAVQEAAACLGAEITWGGSWKTLKDGPHFQIENV